MGQPRKVHLLRPPLPWQSPDDRVTLCGRDTARALGEAETDVHAYRRRGGTWWSSRMVNNQCTTCHLLAWSWDTWEDDPAGLLARWVDGTPAGPRRRRLVRDLRIIAGLAEMHRDEFDAELVLWAFTRESG